ncbi:MAG: hypothetical protein OWS74_08025, partial [Firmicutes bacterium]|nr:hypothetical protein [Bacillota bacterium]
MVGDAPDMTIADVVSSDNTVDITRLDHALHEISSNVFMLSAPATPVEAEDVRLVQVVEILQHLQETYTYVVLDTAAGYSDVNVAVFDFSDMILTVCTPDIVTLRTVGQALQVFRDGFRYAKNKVRIVLNRNGSNTGVDLKDIAAVLGEPVLYTLPSEGALPVRAANDGNPLMVQYPQSALSQGILAMASAIAQVNSQETGMLPALPDAKISLWARLFRRKSLNRMAR